MCWRPRWSRSGDALAGTDRQKNRLYELLELGEYDLELFRERMAAVKEKRVALEKKEAELERSLRGDPMLQPRSAGREDPRRSGCLWHRRRRWEKCVAEIRPGGSLV